MASTQDAQKLGADSTQQGTCHLDSCRVKSIHTTLTLLLECSLQKPHTQLIALLHGAVQGWLRLKQHYGHFRLLILDGLRCKFLGSCLCNSLTSCLALLHLDGDM